MRKTPKQLRMRITDLGYRYTRRGNKTDREWTRCIALLSNPRGSELAYDRKGCWHSVFWRP